MVGINKCGRIQWTKDERKSLMSAFEENPTPSLTDRIKLAQLLNISTKKVTNWFRGQRRKMNSGLKVNLKVPNLLKRRKKASKSGNEDLKTQLLKSKSNDKDEDFSNVKISAIKLNSREENAGPSKHNVSLKSNTDANFLDRSAHINCNEKSPKLSDKSQLETISISSDEEIREVVDFRNIESLISKQSNAVANIQEPKHQNPVLVPNVIYSKTLDFENDDLEEILDLHVDMIAESNFDDNDDELNAYQPVTETLPIISLYSHYF